MCDKIVPVLVINYKMVISVIVCVWRDSAFILMHWFWWKNRTNWLCAILSMCAQRAQYNLIAFQYIESMGNPMKMCNEIFTRHCQSPLNALLTSINMFMDINRARPIDGRLSSSIVIDRSAVSVCMHACMSQHRLFLFRMIISTLNISHQFDKIWNSILSKCKLCCSKLVFTHKYTCFGIENRLIHTS